MPDEAARLRPLGGQETQATADLATVEGQLLHSQELLTEIRHQCDALEQRVEAQQQQIEQAAVERAELHRLLAGLEARLQAAPRVQADADALGNAGAAVGGGWREGKRGLGASLTLTGVAALAAGFLLHFALQQRFIVSAAHLGYIIGLVGLLTFLLGLLLVF